MWYNSCMLKLIEFAVTASIGNDPIVVEKLIQGAAPSFQMNCLCTPTGLRVENKGDVILWDGFQGIVKEREATAIQKLQGVQNFYVLGMYRV